MRKLKIVTIVIMGLVLTTSTLQSKELRWDPIPIKKHTEYNEEETLSPSDKLLQKVMSRIQNKKNKNTGGKITNSTTTGGQDNIEPPVNGVGNYGDLKTYVDSNYPGLFTTGTTPVSPHIIAHDAITNKYSEKFGVDPNLMRALMSQECYGGVCDGTNRAAWGPGQIEYTLKNEFKAFGEKYFNKSFQITRNKTTDDRLNPEYNIAFACERFSIDLKRYDGDYPKAIQAYNFSHYSLNKLLERYPNGNEWLDRRKDMAYINGWYARGNGSSYGDNLYVEHVLKFYQ